MVGGQVASSLSGLGAFVSYFVVALGLTGVFLFVYARVTPYREVRLIGEGNLAAAYSYGGALLGFALPLASAISHSVGLADMAVWGAVALAVQLLAFAFVRLIIPGIVTDIPANNIAKGFFLGIISVVAGIINAACMTY